MKPEAQRIAIAEFCKGAGAKMPIITDEDGCPYEGMPDYLNDLNAIQEAALSLPPIERMRFANNLAYAVTNRLGGVGPFDFCCARAAERAEVLLRTIGKWSDKP